MIIEGSTVLGGPPLKTQVGIVGSGQAGITLAWYLIKKGIDVTLLEGSRPVTINAWAEVRDKMVFNGHHLGTTRMSATEKDGVQR
ncbi:MAG: NAD(P)-binding protein [bacterium]|nr:NAD(P)-binding protein [bacterium]